MLKLDEPKPELLPSKAAVPEPRTYIEHPLLTLERLEFQDERAKLRMREAIWISLSVHLVGLLILFILLPKYLAQREREAAIRIQSADQLIKDKDLTYLELPPSLVQKPKTRSDVLSDQDRRAASKAPRLEPPEPIRNSSVRPGAPGLNAPPLPQQKHSSPARQSAPQQGRQQQEQPIKPEQQSQSQQTAKLENIPAPTEPDPGAFSTGGSAGSTIQQAVKAAASNRGNAGDFGSVPTPQRTNNRQDFEILSDTMGWDFAPYMQRIRRPITLNWWNAMPESVSAPLYKKGGVVLEFTIQRSGLVTGLKMARSSGDVALDRAAWAAISGSNPFPNLPPEFHGDSFTIRAHFSYNPDRPDVR